MRRQWLTSPIRRSRRSSSFLSDGGTAMFALNSRYVNCPIVEVETVNGAKTKGVKLRRPPYVAGHITELKGTDRLDLMAHRNYQDGTKFWHIADANTELEANGLVKNERPENPLVTENTPQAL